MTGTCSKWENHLTEFSNHLRLQQWELTQCFAQYLIKYSPSDESRTRVFNLLRSVTTTFSPLSLRCLPGQSNESLNKFIWFCLTLLREFGGGNSSREEVEFHIVLDDVFPEVPPHVLKEFCRFFPESGELDPTIKLSDDLVEMLYHSFSEKPHLTNSLISYLLQLIGNDSSSEAILAQLYSVYWRNLDESYRDGKDYSTTIALLPDSALQDAKTRSILNRVISQDAVGTLLGRGSPVLLQQYFEDEVFFEESYLNVIVDEDINFNELFVHTLKKGKHFLESLMMVAANQVLMKGEMPSAFNNKWKKLKSLIIFASLQLCKTDIEFANIMNAIARQIDNSGHFAADNLGRTLRRNLFLMKWCTERARGLPLDAEKYIFETLQTQSLLHVLNKYIGLQNIEPFDMLKMFQESAEFAGGQITRNDLAVYRGYLATYYAMQAVNASAKIEMLCSETDPLVCVENEKAMVESLLKDGFKVTYSRFVGSKLESLRNELLQIFPVTFRIEVMENIFSLLFVTRSDMIDTLSEDSDEGYIGDEPRTEPSLCDPEEDGKNELLKKVSLTLQSSTPPDGNTSSSSCAMSKEGFLCNEPVVGDLLSLLKDSILDAMPLVYAVVGNKNEKVVDDNIHTSVNYENIQSRASTLSAYVLEAHWRFLLLSGEENTQLKSRTDTNTKEGLKNRRQSLLDASYRERKKKKKRRIRRLSIVEGRVTGGIIYKMLSSPESLLRFSILQRNLNQADEVIKVFNLTNLSDILELQFCVKLPDILKRLNAGVFNKMPATSMAFGKELTAVAQAASEGLRTTSEMIAIDKILPANVLPKIPELELLEPDTAQLLEFKDPQSVVLADLAYTSCSNLERTLFLLEKAAQRFRNGMAEDISKPFGSKGVVLVLRDMIKFIKEVPRATSNCVNYVRETSMAKLLVNQLGLLESQSVKEHSDFWEAFFDHFSKVRELLAEDEQTTVVLSEDERKSTPERLHAAFLELSRLCWKNFDYQGSRKRIDYLGSLYDRLKRVSYVLAECGQKPGSLVQQSYFSVLQHNHVKILGTLVLQRKLSLIELKKLEEFAQQLQVDLVNVILQTCCPAIAVNRQMYLLNDSSLWEFSEGNKNLSDPLSTAQCILSSFIDIFRRNNSNGQNTLLSVDAAIHLASQPQMNEWLESCGQLANVDLSSLSSQEQKLAFFANVTNIAWMWAVFTHLKNIMFASKKTKLQLLHPCSHLLSSYPVERFISQKTTLFSIGQIGAISLYDLKHNLVVGDGPVPSHYLVPPSKFSLDSLKDYYPSAAEPRMLFVLNECFLNSPRLQILYPENVLEQLDCAMMEYLTNHVEVDIIHEIVKMPVIMQWYRQSFVEDNPNALYEGLCSFVAHIIGGDMKASLQSLQSLDSGSSRENGSELPFVLEFTPLVQFGIVFDYELLSPSVDEFAKMSSASMLPDYAINYIGQHCSPLAQVLNSIGDDTVQTPFGRQLQRWRNLCDSSKSVDFVETVLSPALSGPYFWEQVQRCIDEKNYEKALRYTEETNDPGALLLQEYILLILCVSKPTTDCPEPWSYALRIQNAKMRYDAIVQSLTFWSEDESLTALAACLALSSNDSLICLLLEKKIKEMHIYKKTLKVLKLGPSTISRWQDLKDIPLERIVVELRTLGKMDLLHDWTQLHKEEKFETSGSSLKQKTNLYVDVDDQTMDDGHLNIGMQILSIVPEKDQGLYLDLVEKPFIMLEQLLMNAELATAGRAIASITENLKMEELQYIRKLVERYAEKAVDFSVVEVLSDSAEISSVLSVATDDHFVMPARVPTKDQWVPDSSVATCMVCLEEHFSMFSRRHHCRRCGRVVCASCSQHSLVVHGYGKDPVRVCDDCFEHSTFVQVGTPSSASSDKLSHLFDRAFAPTGRSRSDSFRVAPYILSLNETETDTVREEFTYDQAPSVSLCLSILKLHYDPKQCGDFMLTLCDNMFAKLIPRDKGRPNPEVDYALVISMMKSLLLNAKVKFVEANHKIGEQYSDKYLSHLDLTYMLVRGNCTHLIPKDDIASDETFRRIRDSLLEEERFTLALEISTKCGLELSSLWAAWGMICLRAGEWTAAREKFSRCLPKLKDHNQSQQESPLLKDIISFLEDFRSSLLVKPLGIQMKSLEDIVQKALEECNYYLHNYGSHSSIVSFYQRHGRFTDALKHIIEKVTDLHVFVSSLFMPSVHAGRLGVLLQQIRTLDPTLAKTWRCLIATCSHLKHQNFYHVLYRVQLFMEDYIRAGMTSIHFFKVPASRCIEHFERLSHLEAARHNFKLFLKKSPDGRETLKVASEELERHLQTLTLQSKITNYLYVCESKDLDIRIGNIFQKLLTLDQSQLVVPTLFDSVAQKTILAVLLLLYGVFEEGGMDLALLVISNYNLDGTKICSRAAEELVIAGEVNELLSLISFVRIRPASYSLDMDKVIAAAVTQLANQPAKSKEVEMLIRQMSSDVCKIKSYITCGKLKSAYLLAINLGQVSQVEHIRDAAASTGQSHIQTICQQWLQLKSKPATEK